LKINFILDFKEKRDDGSSAGTGMVRARKALAASVSVLKHLEPHQCRLANLFLIVSHKLLSSLPPPAGYVFWRGARIATVGH
jgi:hypothetical protein